MLGNLCMQFLKSTNQRKNWENSVMSYFCGTKIFNLSRNLQNFDKLWYFNKFIHFIRLFCYSMWLELTMALLMNIKKCQILTVCVFRIFCHLWGYGKEKSFFSKSVSPIQP